MNEFSRLVADKIADRDGMVELVSEEVENQGVGISTDAVQSMIDTAIQQFADSLEVMVSAKLNINK
jgi:PHP family Zn ribbon phosphoesterase